MVLLALLVLLELVPEPGVGVFCAVLAVLLVLVLLLVLLLPLGLLPRDLLRCSAPFQALGVLGRFRSLEQLLEQLQEQLREQLREQLVGQLGGQLGGQRGLGRMGSRGGR